MPFPIVVPVSTGTTPTTFPTTLDYVNAIADQLGDRLRSTIASGGVGGEPGRWALVDALKDDEDERARFAGGWIYLENGTMAGSSRRIRSEGYEGPYGALSLSRVLEVSGTPTRPTGGTIVQVTQPLPIDQVGTVRGIKQFANEGLSRVWTRARIPLTGNGTRLYGLSGYSHITSPDWAEGVYDWFGQTSTTVPAMRVPWESVIKVDGATITLETAIVYSTGMPFELAVFVPADRLVYDSSMGVWSYTTAGLVADNDQGAVPIAWMLPASMKQALNYLMRLVRADRTLTKEDKAERLQEIANQRLPWIVAAADITTNVLPRPDAAPSHGMLGYDELRTTTYWRQDQTTTLPASVVP